MDDRMTEAGSRLEALERRARHDLDCVDYPAREWVASRTHEGQPVIDVVIVGGGQSGTSLAFRLMRERITNIRVLERNPAGQEGPWVTFARMRTLRTPKGVSGPEFGIPSLSVRAWWEAKFGENSWGDLGRIPKELWNDYLKWLRGVSGIPIENGVEVTGIEPLSDDLFAVTVTKKGAPERILARNVVLATGIEGCGRWIIPEMFSDVLPREAYAHTSERIDFTALAGKRIAVIGAGASAFDNAAEALEHGAASVDLFVRRKEIPTVNPNRWMEFAGFMRHFGDLDDARKWRFVKTIFDRNQPPPQDTYERCARFPSFAMHTGSPVLSVAYEDGKAVLTTPAGAGSYDFVIIGTGFGVDFAARPELSRFAGEIATWSDRYQPPAGEEHAQLGGYPYLSDCFQFTEKTPGAAPYLRHIFSYTYAAMPSLAGSAGISALKFGLDRLSRGITRELFLADADTYYESLAAYGEIELTLPQSDAETQAG